MASVMRAKPQRQREKNNKQNDRPPSSVTYGLLPVIEALRADSRRIDKVLLAEGAKERRISKIMDLCRARSIPFSRVPRDAFAKHIGTDVHHQGVLAFTSASDYVETDMILENGTDVPLIL